MGIVGAHAGVVRVQAFGRCTIGGPWKRLEDTSGSHLRHLEDFETLADCAMTEVG